MESQASSYYYWLFSEHVENTRLKRQPRAGNIYSFDSSLDLNPWSSNGFTVICQRSFSLPFQEHWSLHLKGELAAAASLLWILHNLEQNLKHWHQFQDLVKGTRLYDKLIEASANTSNLFFFPDRVTGLCVTAPLDILIHWTCRITLISLQEKESRQFNNSFVFYNAIRKNRNDARVIKAVKRKINIPSNSNSSHWEPLYTQRLKTYKK